MSSENIGLIITMQVFRMKSETHGAKREFMKQHKCPRILPHSDDDDEEEESAEDER